MWLIDHIYQNIVKNFLSFWKILSFSIMIDEIEVLTFYYNRIGLYFGTKCYIFSNIEIQGNIIFIFVLIFVIHF